jgi:hypothetical protein
MIFEEFQGTGHIQLNFQKLNRQVTCPKASIKEVDLKLKFFKCESIFHFPQKVHRSLTVFGVNPLPI